MRQAFELAIPPAALLMLFLALMLLVARFLPFAAFELPVQTGLMAVLAGGGFAIILAGVISFRRHRTSVDPRDPKVASTLVDSGIFALTRNPMYLGMASMLAGIALGVGNWLALLLVPLFVIWIDRFQIAPEERVLEQAFGEAYRSYCQRTRRWL